MFFYSIENNFATSVNKLLRALSISGTMSLLFKQLFFLFEDL